MIYIITNLQTKELAQKIGKNLLEKRLVACYNLFPIESAYWWKGKILEEAEVTLILKTIEKNFPKIESFINKNSVYEMPEIAAVKVDKANKSYLSWLDGETRYSDT